MLKRVRRPPRALSDGVTYRKILDRVKTLEKYEARILAYPTYYFAPLHGAYVSDYVRSPTAPDNPPAHIPILLQVCATKGIHVLGVVSENKPRDVVDVDVDVDVDAQRIIFVGQANHLTGRELCPFSILGKDKVWCSNVPD
jgi:tryptophan synthase alpha subunit